MELLFFVSATPKILGYLQKCTRALLDRKYSKLQSYLELEMDLGKESLFSINFSRLREEGPFFPTLTQLIEYLKKEKTITRSATSEDNAAYPRTPKMPSNYYTDAYFEEVQVKRAADETPLQRLAELMAKQKELFVQFSLGNSEVVKEFTLISSEISQIVNRSPPYVIK